MHRVKEHDIINTVNDFMVFCNYLDEKKPVLSKKRAMLGKNDLFVINSLLSHKREVSAPNYQQESYPIINMVFNLVLLGKLYVRKADDKGNIYLNRTVRKNEFDNLNIYEKYAFLFETFWIRYDLEEVMRWGLINNIIDQTVQIIANSNPGQKLEKGSFSQRADYDPIFSYSSVIIQYFDYFGFCRYIPIIVEGKKKNKYDDSIKTIIPTKLGVNICKILTEQKIEYWNIPWLKELGMNEKDIVPDVAHQFQFTMFPLFTDNKNMANLDKLYDETKQNGFIPLYKLIKPIFPEGVLNNTIRTSISNIVKGSYIFKVSLGKGIWRKIKLSFKHTLEDLHDSIQKAFDFDDDHLYSFFMDGKRYSRHAFHSPMCNQGPYVNESIIGELELFIKQKFLYFFDYGDSWEFEVQLLEIDEDEIPPRKPQIIETKGEAPAQYW